MMMQQGCPRLCIKVLSQNTRKRGGRRRNKRRGEKRKEIQEEYNTKTQIFRHILENLNIIT